MFGRLFGRSRKENAPPERAEIRASDPTVGLCFDYAPGIAFTSEYLSEIGLQQILEELASRKLRATFNCPARLCEISPDRLSPIVEAGHEIAILGYEDESPEELQGAELKQLLSKCRAAFGKRGLDPVGFKSPHFKENPELTAALAKQNFHYEAVHNHARWPSVCCPGPPPMIHIPIRTDDRGLRRSEDTCDATISKHHRALRKALQGRHFVSICFHPWILAEDQERMEHWQAWLRAAVNSKMKIGALEDLLPSRES